MLLDVSNYLRTYVMQDPQEMEWIRGMQDVFFLIFLVGLSMWAVALFFRSFWKPDEEVPIAENDSPLHNGSNEYAG